LVSRAAVAAVVALLVPPPDDGGGGGDDDDGGRGGEEGGSVAARLCRPEPPGFDRLFDALQAAAEAGGGLDPMDPALDGWLPAAALGRLAEGAVAGAARLWGRVAVGAGRGWCGAGEACMSAGLPPLVRALGVRE